MNDGKKLRYLRTQKGITQREAAEALGVCMQTYNRYENGNRPLQLKFIAKASKFYNVPPSYFDEQVAMVGIGNNGYTIKNTETSDVMEVTAEEFKMLKGVLDVYRNK